MSPDSSSNIDKSILSLPESSVGESTDPASKYGGAVTVPLSNFRDERLLNYDKQIVSGTQHFSAPTSHKGTSSYDDHQAQSSRNDKPKWLQESLTRYGLRMRMGSQIPVFSKIVTWVRGPVPPRLYSIQPLLPRMQSLPQKLLTNLVPGQSGELLAVIIIFALWLIIFSVILTIFSRRSERFVNGQQPIKLYCTSALWPNASSCGLDGSYCQPFDGFSFPFICPAGCASTELLEPYTVGDQEINYRSLVIGGEPAGGTDPAFYRGDSFICPAAIHAGVISNTYGGGGILSLIGEKSQFPSNDKNGILSISFPSSFPLSFSMVRGPSQYYDPQWYLLIVAVIMTSAVSLVTTSPLLFFTPTFIIFFFQVALASDSPHVSNFATLLSTAFERFLPTCFVATVVYQYCVRYTLRGLKAQWEKTILWVGGCWVGALNVYTFDKIPISRLTPHDLKQQPGAIVALIVIVVVLLVAAVGQVWVFRVEGRLPQYLAFYVGLGIVLGCLTTVPDLNLRLHHYIIGLLILPITSIQTRLSLLYQGLAMGLFINGVARWGYASILQTSAALLGEAQIGSPLPHVSRPTFNSSTISFTINTIAEMFNGFSVLVNDVERYQETNVSIPAAFNWTRKNQAEPLFFRFAFTGTDVLGGTWYGDFTKAGTWYGNGTWRDILPGPSK